jgi:hypothetical protein
MIGLSEDITSLLSYGGNGAGLDDSGGNLRRYDVVSLDVPYGA